MRLNQLHADAERSVADARIDELADVAAARLRLAGATAVQASSVSQYGAWLTDGAGHAGYMNWPQRVLMARDALRALGGAPLVAAFHRCVLLNRISASRGRLNASPLCGVASPWFERAVSGMVAALLDAPDATLDFHDDGFAKDLSVASLRLYPFGALVVEPRTGIGRRTILSHGLATLLGAARALGEAGGFRPFYETHTYTRTLSEFTSDGRKAGFQRIASVMARDRAVLGVYGSAWYYDPALERISPHLAHVRHNVLEGGATIVEIARNLETVPLATLKSPTRRALFQRGEYTPRQFLMIWPRDRLLRWAGLR
ncbi:MAG: hypothetical protein NVS4B3_15900 [Gemmatimonadaceae bacterium]